MGDEQFERHKEFMLQQQALSAVRIAQMEDLLVRFAQATRERFEVTDKRSHEMDKKIAALIDAQIRADDRVAELDNWTKESATDFDRRLKESAADFDRRYAILLDSQRLTEETVRKLGERIDSLAVTVDWHIVEGHNGRARPEG